MKQLKSEYKIVLNKVQELDKNYQNAITLLEQRSPDIVMGTCFQEMHRLEMQKIKTLELKIQELEDNIARFNSPSELNTHFNFTLDNNALRYSPNSSVQTVITPMSPFIL